MNLEVKTITDEETAFITISGEVDLYSSPRVREQILAVTKKKMPLIVINLEMVTYMDSSGVATLIEGLQLCNKYKGRFILVGLKDNVREVFELSRLDRIFQIRETFERAQGI
ncbi:STAS domain-containing protein [candidate division KSB1 bacterium]|nr:STAS domain-containing protein [candidate division KSB1 bacterium]